MGRSTRQKRQRRSSTAKGPKQNHGPKKLVFGDRLIAQNWNHKESFSKNYARLGLTSRLANPTGGTEKDPKKIGTVTEPVNPEAVEEATDKLRIQSRPATMTVTPKEARVERDPETGELKIVEDPYARERPNPLNDRLVDIEDSDDEEEEWDGFTNLPEGEGKKTDLVRQLEERALTGVRNEPRRQSTREEEWVEKLVEKYGDDYEGMFWDRKLNPMQQTVGDIRRRVKKWRAKHAAQ